MIFDDWRSSDYPHLKGNALSDNVFRHIEKKIICLEYLPGSLLNEKSIATELGISRTPVREAIKKLEMDGLVKSVLNRGTFVVGLTDADLDKILIIRAFLEGLCTRWVTLARDEKILSQLKDTVDMQQFYRDRGNYLQCWELGHTFHRIIYTNSQSRHVFNLLKTYHNYIYLRIKSNIMSQDKDYSLIGLVEHNDIYNAIKAGDADLSERLMSEHLKNTHYTIMPVPSDAKVCTNDTAAEQTGSEAKE